MAAVPNRASELAAFWSVWNGSKNITDDAEKHRFTAAFMADLNRRDGSGRWGRKARAGTDAISKDTGGYWLGAEIWTRPVDGQLHAFDLIVGSTGAVKWDTAAENGDPLYNNITARWFPVIVPTMPPVDPPPSTDLTPRVVALERQVSELQMQVNQLNADVSTLTARVDAVQPVDVAAAVALVLARYEATGSTSRTLAHSHGVRLNLTRKP